MKIELNFLRAIIRPVGVALAVIIVNILIAVILILCIGSDPWTALSALYNSSFGDLISLTNVLTRATPLILTGLAAAIAFSAGIYNLGGEGQVYLGAFAAAWVGFTFKDLPPGLHLPLALAASALAGAIGAGIPGWLKVRFDVDEVISTLLLNSVYILLTGYLASYPFRDPARWSGTTPPIAPGAQLPVILPSTGLTAGILFAILLSILAALLLRNADQGYRWRMTGLNKLFSRYGGLNVPSDQMKAMLLSGVLAGLAGGALVTGSQNRFWSQIGGGVGWDGVLVALLAGNHPIGVMVAGVLFAAVKTGSLGMEQASGVPSELSNVLLALLILIVTAREFAPILVKRLHFLLSHK